MLKTLKYILILLCINVFGQPNDTAHLSVDSLEIILADSDDDMKVKLLVEMSDEYLPRSLDKAWKLADSAYKLALLRGDKQDIALALLQQGKVLYDIDSLFFAIEALNKAYPIFVEYNDSANLFQTLNYLGYIYFDLGEYDKALEYQNRSLEIEKNIDNQIETAHRLMDIGSVYEYAGNYEKALAYYNQALKLFREIDYKDGEANVLNRLGNVYLTWSKYEKSLKFYIESLEIQEELNDQIGIAAGINNIGVVYYDWEQFDKALEYFLKGLEIEKRINNQKGIAQSLNNIAIIYDEKGQKERALNLYKESYELAAEVDDKMNMAIASSNIGEFYKNEGDYEKSMEYYMLSLKHDKSIGNQTSIGATYNLIGNLYHSMHDYGKALEYYQKSLDIVIPKELLVIISENYKGMAETHARLGNYKKAYDLYVEFHSLNDSIFSETLARQINMLQTSYEIDKREKEIQLLNADKQLKELEITKKKQQIARQRNIGTGLIIGFSLLAFLSLLLYRQVRVKKETLNELDRQYKLIQEKQEELLKAKEKAEESDQLKSTFLINLSHEIRTPMNAIVGFSEMLKEKKTRSAEDETYIEEIQANTRQLLSLINNIVDISAIETGHYNIKKTRTNISKLLKQLYARVSDEQKVSGKENIHFNLNLDQKSREIVALVDEKSLLQVLENLVNNAFKYTNKGFIDLEFSQVNASLHFTVNDTGIGIPEEKQEIIFEKFRQADESSTRKFIGTGLGLAISKELVELMGGRLWVDSEVGKGSTFHVELPYEPAS